RRARGRGRRVGRPATTGQHRLPPRPDRGRRAGAHLGPDRGGGGVITFEQVTITHAGADAPVLRAVDLVVPEGDPALVVGPTGAGRAGRLGAVSGLVRHFTGGHLAGRVLVDGRDTRVHPPRELADVVGVVGQDPLAGFVTDVVEDELAFGMEQLGLPTDV